MPGDTLYMKIVARNPHAESVYIMNHFLLFTSDIQIHLIDSENQIQALLFEGPPMSAHADQTYAEIKPRTSRIIKAMSINVPPLEDLEEPFWEKHLKNLSRLEKNETLSLCVTLYPSCKVYPDYKHYHFQSAFSFQFTFETPLIMKPRPEKEMTLIRKWLRDSPKELLPAPFGDLPKVPPFDSRMRYVTFENILVKGEKVPQSQFMRSSNRYPGHPNAPETWQGWKELEENLTPSTMRDEIRLARILIQYSDTEDNTLIKELKDWFADMNEVQRSVLVKRTRNKIKMYEAVKEFDTALLEWEKEHLRNLGIIE